MVSFCTPDELTLPSFSQHFSENGGLQACHYDMSRAGRSTSGFQILYPQVSSCRPEPELRFAAINPSLDLVVPRPKRVAKLQSFIEATQDPTADVFKGYPTSTDHCPLSNMTGMDYSSAKFGGSSHLPAISTSTSFAPPLPRRPPTHSAALWNPPQARTNWTIPIDVSDPFVPEYFPAGSATQTSGTPPDMRSASPRGSLFDSPSFGTRLAADDSHYGAMPAESSWGPRHTRVDTVKHMPIAMSHRELAQLFCDSDRPATSTSTPPPPYGWIDRRSGADVYSPIGSPAADRYSSTNTLGRLPSLAQPNPFASFAGGGESSRDESWLQGIELRSTSTDPYAQSQERPVSHANIEIDFNDFTQSGESRHPSRDRYTQNKPWLWDKITTGASCARRYIMGKLPKHRWP